MEELLEKIENLKKKLDEEECIVRIKELNQKVEKDSVLQELVKRYRSTLKEEDKKKLINYPLYREYKEQETEVNILILKINQRLKEIQSKGGCSL